jgi:hypothetical protein
VIGFGPLDSSQNLNISGHPPQFPSGLPKPSNKILESELADYEMHIPPHLRNFHSVFFKESFDNLPKSKPWDHTIELVADATAKSCKVYPLTASEQKELNVFLKENLESSQIHPT